MGWTNLHNLIYYLFGISHLTNGKVSDEEKAATIKIAKEYFDESVDFESIYREIQGDYLKDMGFPNHTKEGWIKVQKQTIACAKAFATNSSGDATNNISFLLKDTIALFKSKGGFSEAEKNMIDTLAKHWNIDKDWLYDDVNEEENNLDEIIEDYLQNYNEESEEVEATEESEETNEEETSIEKIIREWNSEGMIEIEKKDFIHHLSIIYPELKENTIKTMITTMIVNKRTRTYYHGCKKPRKCSSQNNYDFLYLNDDNYLTRYDEGKHGLWEIFQRQDGKLDVRLIS